MAHYIFMAKHCFFFTKLLETEGKAKNFEMAPLPSSHPHSSQLKRRRFLARQYGNHWLEEHFLGMSSPWLPTPLNILQIFTLFSMGDACQEQPVVRC